MRKTTPWLIFSLMMVATASAAWQSDGSCQAGTLCPLIAPLRTENGTLITYADCFLYVVNETNGNMLVSALPMNNLANGFYNTTLNFSRPARYPSVMSCNWTDTPPTTNFNQSMLTTFIVAGGLDMSWQTSIPLLLLIVAGFFAFMTVHYSKKAGLLNLFFRDLGIFFSQLFVILAVAVGKEVLNAANTANTAFLNNIGTHLDTAFYILLPIIFLTFVFLTIEFYLATMEYFKKSAGGEDGI